MDFTKIKIDDSFSPGEKSRVRRIRIDDSEEMMRFKEIKNDLNVAESVEEIQQMSDEDLRNFAGVYEDRKGVVAVVGKQGYVSYDQVNKLQGWIFFYPDEDERIMRLKEKGILGESFNGMNIVEVSYAKHPKAVGGQMSSGLRQMMKIILRRCATTGELLVLTAYTDKKNLNSSRLLASCGFVRIGQIEYHPGAADRDEVWIRRLY